MTNLILWAFFVLGCFSSAAGTLKRNDFFIKYPVISLHKVLKDKDEGILYFAPNTYQNLIVWEKEDKSHSCLVFKGPGRGDKGGSVFLLENTSECSLKHKDKYQELMTNVASISLFGKVKTGMNSITLKVKDNRQQESIVQIQGPFLLDSSSPWKGITTLNNLKAKNFINDGESCFQGCSGESSLNRCSQCDGNLTTLTLNMKCMNEAGLICGANLCGARGETACVRMVSFKTNTSCEEAEHYVYCQKGLSLDCRPDGSILCQ